MYFAFSGIARQEEAPEIQQTRVVIANLDQTSQGGFNAGQFLVDFLNNEQLANLFDVSVAADENSARAAVDRQEAGVAIIIPSNFSAAVTMPNGSAEVLLVQDPTLTLGPQILKDVLNQFLDGFSGGKITLDVVNYQLSSQGITLTAEEQMAVAGQYTDWITALGASMSQATGSGNAQPYLDLQAPSPNQQDETAQPDFIANLLELTMTGQLIFFAFYTAAYTAQTILQEEEEGTLGRLFTTPTRPEVILAGKYVSVFITVIVQALVLMTIARLIFNTRWGSPVSVAIALVSLVVVTSGVGVLLISFIRNYRQSGAVLGGVLSTLGILGGLFTVTVPNLPPIFNRIAVFTPTGWALKIWKLALQGSPISDFVLPMVVTVVIGVLCFTIGATLFRRRFAY
jgi:ABC-type transport system involved in multi-copper enzyme maturation permease subunit